MQRSIAILLLPLIAVLLPDLSAADDEAERLQLIERRAQLQEAVRNAQKEQDLLLFRKSMYAADSKYLVLDPAAGKATLWYRNRLLKSIRLTVISRHEHGGKGPEIITLTVRSSWGAKPGYLLFSDRLLLTDGRGPRPKVPAAIRASVSPRDMTSLRSVLDRGSLACLML